MAVEPIYSIATAGDIKIPVKTGELDVTDGIASSSYQPRTLQVSRKQSERIKKSQPQRTKTQKELRLKRKRERQNRKKGRK